MRVFEEWRVDDNDDGSAVGGKNMCIRVGRIIFASEIHSPRMWNMHTDIDSIGTLSYEIERRKISLRKRSQIDRLLLDPQPACSHSVICALSEPRKMSTLNQRIASGREHTATRWEIVPSFRLCVLWMMAWRDVPRNRHADWFDGPVDNLYLWWFSVRSPSISCSQRWIIPNQFIAIELFAEPFCKHNL